MGTEVRVLLYSDSAGKAANAAAAAFARISVLDSLMSDYRTDSEVHRIAQAAGGEAVPVSDEMVYVLERALRIAAETEGMFDPSIGPVTRLWRSARRTGSSPDSLALAAARRLVDWRAIELDTIRHTVRLRVPGMSLDLGAIAKGYAADEALRVLREHGLARALVAFGGEIVAGRPPPDRDGWRVTGLRPAIGAPATIPSACAHRATRCAGEIVPAPRPSPRREPVEWSRSRLAETILLADGALSASGDTEQFLYVDGVRHSHVIDTRSGRGRSGGARATVRAPDGITADVLATAATLLDEDDRARFIAAHPEAEFRLFLPRRIEREERIQQDSIL